MQRTGWGMFKGFILGIVITIVVALGAGYAVLRTGLIPANADASPSRVESWAARTSLRATLSKEAPKGPNPIPLTDANLTQGITLYGARCVVCHGGPGGNASASPIAKGENPRPPQLASHGVEDDPQGVTFWVITHGVRWTGMPSWKAALNDQQIWTLTLFLKNMDKLPPAAQAAWKQVGIRRPAPPEPSVPPTSPGSPAPSAPPPSSPPPP